jgi:hypothetical protein
MLLTLAVVLFLLWTLAVVSATTMGGFIHVLLIAAVVLAVVRLAQGAHHRRPVEGS